MFHRIEGNLSFKYGDIKKKNEWALSKEIDRERERKSEAMLERHQQRTIHTTIQLTYISII